MGKIVTIDGLNRYHENLKSNVLTTKQDVIEDLVDIRSNAAAGATALDSAKTYADGLVKDEEGKSLFDAVGSAAAAQAAAEATAAADATSKANAAQSAAEATAAADATSKANAAQSAAEATAAADATSKANTAEQNAKTHAESLVQNEDGSSKFDAAGSAAAAQSAAEATAAADATSKANAAQSAAEATAAADATSKADAAESAAKTYADGLVKDAEGKVKFDAAGSAAAAQSAAEATAAADATSKANAAQAAAEQKATEYNTAMNERVVKLEAIDHEKLALDASATAVAAIVAGADSDFDTLKEVADWILSDTTGAAGLQTTVSGHTEDIKEINEELDGLDETKQDVITDLETIRSGAAAGATALQADDLVYAENSDIDGLFA